MTVQHRLTNRKVKTARPGKHEDGHGPSLVVSPRDAKKWVLRLTVASKRRELGLGSDPIVSLAEAHREHLGLVYRQEVSHRRDYARWRGQLDMLLARPAEVKTASHHPAMPYADVLAELAGNDRMPANALQLLILAATRTSAVLHAEWREVDMEAATWVISASRMKAGIEHRSPLSTEAVRVLQSFAGTFSRNGASSCGSGRTGAPDPPAR